MRIHKPKGISRGQFVLVTILGVFSGIYIWKPMFLDFFKERQKLAEVKLETEKND